jgi:Na+-translocating ferredoxin:NAD+ oxidoreductase RnfG subunit
MMDSTMLTVKFVIFFALELFVLSVLGAALLAGLYHIVQNKIRESRRVDGVAPEVRRAEHHA